MSNRVVTRIAQFEVKMLKKILFIFWILFLSIVFLSAIVLVLATLFVIFGTFVGASLINDIILLLPFK